MSQPCARSSACAARRARDLEADRDIVDRGLPGKQRVGLEQIAGIPVEAGQRLVEDPHRPCGRLQQPGGDVEQRRFPASGRPDDGDELAMRDRQPGLFHRGIDPRIGEPKRHRRVVERDRRRLCRIHPRSLQVPDDALAGTKDKFNAVP